MLLLAGETVHGYTLHRELQSRGLAMQPASMYRRLRTFEQEGWVTSRWSDPISGPRRHVYELTAEGGATLHELSALIAATRENYATFVNAYEIGHGEHDHESVAMAETDRPPSRARLRPHAELLAGWLLLRLRAGATHGYDLHRDVDDAHRLTTDSGTVYRMLRRFEANRWVESRWTKPAGGPRRRVYRLTTTGRRNLDQIADMITTIRDTLDAYLLVYQQRRDTWTPD